MVLEFDKRHLSRFVSSQAGYNSQQMVGEAPLNWLLRAEALSRDLPDYCALAAVESALTSVGAGRRPLTRDEVSSVCRAPANPPLLGYVCAMAWGGQRFHVQKSLANWRELEERCLLLRGGKMTRHHAFDLFSGDHRVSGLGPSYFTKLLYFFSSKESYCYIMDQWTAKSMILLTGNPRLVRISRKSLSSSNTGADYETFCCAVDALAQYPGLRGYGVSRDDIEERLFSVGGKDSRAGDWRQYVRRAWEGETSMQ